MIVVRLQELFVQCSSSKAGWHEKPKEENPFKLPIEWKNVVNAVSKNISNRKQSKNHPIKHPLLAHSKKHAAPVRRLPSQEIVILISATAQKCSFDDCEKSSFSVIFLVSTAYPTVVINITSITVIKMPNETVFRFYYWQINEQLGNEILKKLLNDMLEGENLSVESVRCEFTFCVVSTRSSITNEEIAKLKWLIERPFNMETLAAESAFAYTRPENRVIIEIGTRPYLVTPFNINAVVACKLAGLNFVSRLEKTRRYCIHYNRGKLSLPIRRKILTALHDRMTECEYTSDVVDFGTRRERQKVQEVEIMIDDKVDLTIEDEDIKYMLDLFKYKLKRNPTDVEIYDLTQSNSVIRGLNVLQMRPVDPTEASEFQIFPVLSHIVLAAETNNFQAVIVFNFSQEFDANLGICPSTGAASGTGGRIRNIHATGRGAYVVAGIFGLAFGNLNVPGHRLPWERCNHAESCTFASPLQICVQASDGSSEYGNKFGEPVICGFTRSFDQYVNELACRYAYLKPVMFSGGVGRIDEINIQKLKPAPGMLIVKLGGPAYRVSLGGGTSSTIEIHGNGCLQYEAVHRGDPGMGQKLNRTIRTCSELGRNNPIISIYDQAAGGNGNVIRKLIEPYGASIESDNFSLGDSSLSIQELWSSEYQESDAILMNPKNVPLIEKICQRERCLYNVLLVKNFHDAADSFQLPKSFILSKPVRSATQIFRKFSLDAPIETALKRVLLLPSVGSKNFITNKVDRSVTGLVAQQQCVGPFHTPVADVAVTALSYFETVGAAVAVGEQPIKMLIHPEVGARLTVGESLTNLDVKCNANWMWPATSPEERYRMLEACDAMCKIMNKLGIAVDGGNESLFLEAEINEEVVKAPGTLVITSYALCTDITKTVTPDLKCTTEDGCLILVRFASLFDSWRLGGCAIAQGYGRTGCDSPDLDNVEQFKSAFRITQSLISEPINLLFSEELGIVIEVSQSNFDKVLNDFHAANVPVAYIGKSKSLTDEEPMIEIKINGDVVLAGSVQSYRCTWQQTSCRLEKLQCNPICVEEEVFRLKLKLPKYEMQSLMEIPAVSQHATVKDASTPCVAILREEGTTGDREMAAAFMCAGFRVWDLSMQDLFDNNISLNNFQGIVFPGGFSYSDVLGASKAWACSILYHPKVKYQIEQFLQRRDTFSLGVCNGCQLMATLGWIGSNEAIGRSVQSVSLEQNISGRFESRFATVRIERSRSIMLRGMENSVLGIWIAHGEGRFQFRDDLAYAAVEFNHLIALRYVDWENEIALAYPYNPNGSPGGIAAICSANGRHLAMMPHPERSFMTWQWPYWPYEHAPVSPWYHMFRNAYEWSFLLRGFNGQWIEPVKCLDYISSSICSGILKVYGEDRCRIDFLFGRYQCCWTCAATLGIPIDSLGRFNDQQGFYFYHPGCPNNVRDAIDALGSSSTQWCMHWKEKNNGMNCYEPLFQYKCYKTCRVKCGAFSD
ncbi:putative phosphoribosylformylglycinamidine synthase, chloroplastic/mitochondrial [Trichinella nativa]|uniref:Phosphoribosylformylglycinamidine synthase, chloroplastic/mitochondrial n=1 Tax=Trichinella nativa TaxID=6335 RepID=A0A0V1LC45_9BILA|nr:putative phosphoribosylformylglycinamidine synthase, chloroplastic/mitochondrial [Trichinella nativa]